MDMYKKIAHIENEADFKDGIEELTDRFGKLPKCAKTLACVALVKSYAQKAKIKRVEQMRDHIRFYPEHIDKMVLYQMSLIDPSRIKICGIKTTPYIMLATAPCDAELTGRVS